MKNLIGLLAFAVIWNGIISIFLIQAYKGWAKGDPEYFLIVFMIPFVAVGIGVIAGVFHSLMALFNPRLEMELHPATLETGRTGRIDWRFNRRPNRVARLTLVLEGREEAIIHTGKNSHTRSSVFHREILIEIDDPVSTPTGSTEIAIPATAMHSFKSKHFAVKWELKVKGDIRLWPDIADAHLLDVMPTVKGAP